MINIIHKYKRPDGKIIELPEVWAEYPEATLDKIVLLHSKQELHGRKAQPGHVWVKSYFMSPDESWERVE